MFEWNVLPLPFAILHSIKMFIKLWLDKEIDETVETVDKKANEIMK